MKRLYPSQDVNDNCENKDDYEQPLGGSSLKRNNTSLFSIATMTDDGDYVGTGIPLSLSNILSDECTTIDTIYNTDTMSCSSNIIIYPSNNNQVAVASQHNSSHYCMKKGENDGGFFIEDTATSTSSNSTTSTSSQERIGALPIFLANTNHAKEKEKADHVSRQEKGALMMVQLPLDLTQQHQQQANNNTFYQNGEKTGGGDTMVVFETGSKHFDCHNRLHKERPLRVESVLNYLKKETTNLVNQDQCHFIVNQSLHEYPTETTRTATTLEEAFLKDDDYLRVHLPGYMQRLDRISGCRTCAHDVVDQAKLDREAEQFKSIYFTPDSVDQTKRAATTLCRLVFNVMQCNNDSSNNIQNGFAVIRPPGHHAEPGLAGGYCIINNVAVAAAFAREKLKVKKVLVVDWDVHHGNGTQSIFFNDPNVLYFSVHRWHGGNFFPFRDSKHNSTSGGPNSVGGNRGAGYNVNVGWNAKGMGDKEYLAVWKCLLLPIANEFQPDLVLVSAGFDAAKNDMGECNVTPNGFAQLTRALMTLANGRIACALEGGYVRSVLGMCVESVVRTLLEASSLPLLPSPTPSAAVGTGTSSSSDQMTVTWERSEHDRNAAAICLPSVPAEPNEKDTNTKLLLPVGNDNERDNNDINAILNKINKSAAKSIRETIRAHQGYWKCLRNVSLT